MDRTNSHSWLYQKRSGNKQETNDQHEPSYYMKTPENYRYSSATPRQQQQSPPQRERKSTTSLHDEQQQEKQMSSTCNNMNDQIDRTLQELKNLMDITAAKLYPVKAQLVAAHNMPDLTAEQETQLLNIFRTQHNPTRVEVGLAAAEVGLTEQQVLSWLSHHFAIWRLTQGLNANEAHVIDVVADRVAHQPPENRRARFSYYCKRTSSNDDEDKDNGGSRSMSRNSSIKY